MIIGVGLRRKKNGKTLDVYYPYLSKDTKLKESLHIETNNKFISLTPEQLTTLKSHNIEFPTSFSNDYSTISTGAFLLENVTSPIQSTEEAYLKLHLLSKRLYKPHEINLEGIFGKLPNIAWSNYGPLLPEDVDTIRTKYYGSNTPLEISHIDKFPYLVNYVIPSNVRIASGSQVRLGAYLGEGTTVMPAGYINFNAGTIGNAMVEGRISAGVVVGDSSDIGGGASIMGTLSGGGTHIISIGDQCLIGANAGTGISLGKGCTIAAGLYVYGGLKVALLNEKNQPVDINNNNVDQGKNIVKAAELSGKDFLLFIQDSQSGEVICKPNSKVIALNETLHQNN